MKIYIFKNKKEASLFVGNAIIKILKANPKYKLGLASGATFVDIYSFLSEKTANDTEMWKDIRTFNLDEFLNTTGKELYSCRNYMRTRLFDNVPLKKSNIWFLPVNDPSKEELKEADLFYRKQKLDAQILGLGVNGHIGFNEPGSKENSRTRIVELQEKTIISKANFFFDGDTSKIQKTAVTVGVESIKFAKKICLIAFGESKNNALNELLSHNYRGGKFPVTYLKDHKELIVITDDFAFKNITPTENWEIIDKRK